MGRVKGSKLWSYKKMHYNVLYKVINSEYDSNKHANEELVKSECFCNLKCYQKYSQNTS